MLRHLTQIIRKILQRGATHDSEFRAVFLATPATYRHFPKWIEALPAPNERLHRSLQLMPPWE